MKKQLQSLVCLVIVAGMLAGCAPSNSGSAYSRDQTRREQSVRLGVVDSVRPVQIEGTRSGVGPASGAVIGGTLGSTVGNNTGSVLAAMVGAVAGGIAGQAAEQGATRKNGVEITVKLDNGQLIAVTQEDDGTSFSPGDHVRVLAGDGVSRVTR